MRLKTSFTILVCATLTLSCGKASDAGSTVTASSCPDIPRVNSGATMGAFVLSGHVVDASGAAVVGARLDLAGSAVAVRFSNLTGGYVFHVNAGSYSLDASGDCQIAPASVDVGNVTGDATYDFTTGGGCVTSVPSNLTSTDSLHTLSQAGSQFGAVVATTIEPTSDDPAGRLQEIATELPTCSLDIAGDSAIEQQGVMTVAGPLDGPDMMQLELATAIAVGSQVVRFDTVSGPDETTDHIDRILAAGRDFTPEELPELHGP